MVRNKADKEISRIALHTFQTLHSGQFLPTELNAGPPAYVKRLDTDIDYILVPLTDATGLRGIVQINSHDLSVESSAMISDPSTVFLLSEEIILNAVKKAFPNKHGLGKPYLAWKPCRESFSSMQPFWVVPFTKGQVYVTQNYKVFKVLTSGLGG